MNFSQTLKKDFQKASIYIRIPFLFFGFILVLILSFPIALPMGDYTLTALQWIFSYYPEDIDPEFMLSIFIADLLWTGSLLVVFLNFVGTKQPAILKKLSLVIIGMTLFFYLIFSVSDAILFWQWSTGDGLVLTE